MAVGDSSVLTNPIDIKVFDFPETLLAYAPSNTTDVCTHLPKYNNDPQVVFKCSMLNVIGCLTDGADDCLYNSKLISDVGGQIECQKG
jgi:hypothetical protein